MAKAEHVLRKVGKLLLKWFHTLMVKVTTYQLKDFGKHKMAFKWIYGDSMVEEDEC